MKMKRIVVFAVVAFMVFALVFSYARYGGTVSDNTSASPDGKIYVTRVYAKIDRIIAVDAKKKSHKKEITEWAYNGVTGEISIAKGLIPFEEAVFHVEGNPVEPFAFILHDYDSEQMPAFVMLNGKPAVENREYVIDGEKLALTKLGKEISSYCILWNTHYGASSTGEMTERESDVFAEAQASWFFENVKKGIMSEKERPELQFADGSTVPRVVMKETTPEERERSLESLPVRTYKNRNGKSMKSLSREVGYSVGLPDSIGEKGSYKRVSTLLIESAVRGTLSRSIEIAYSRDDLFSDEAISITVDKNKGDEGIQYPITTGTLPLRCPVSKNTCWSIVSTRDGNGMQYAPEQYCLYTWKDNEAYYTIECRVERSEEVERFLAGLLK